MIVNDRLRGIVEDKPLKSTLLHYVRSAKEYYGVSNNDELIAVDSYAYKLNNTINQNGAKQSDFFSLDGIWIYRHDPNITSSRYRIISVKSDEGNDELVTPSILSRLNFWEDYNGDWHSSKIDRGYLDGYGYMVLDELEGGGYFQVEDRFYESAESAYYSDSSIFLAGYHSSSPRIINEEANIWLGFEAEKEDREVLLSRTLQEYYEEFPKWRLERDGSLDDWGLECISPVFPLDNDTDRELIENECHKLSEYLEADSSSNCGFHISVSTRPTRRHGTEGLYRKIENWMPLLYALYPSRTSGSYSEAKYKGDSSSSRDCLYRDRNRVEIRIFPACLSVDNVLFRIDLVRYILKNPINETYELADHFKKSAFIELIDRVYHGDRDKLNSLIRRTWKYSKQYNFSTPSDKNLFTEEAEETLETI